MYRVMFEKKNNQIKLVEDETAKHFIEIGKEMIKQGAIEIVAEEETKAFFWINVDYENCIIFIDEFEHIRIDKVYKFLKENINFVVEKFIEKEKELDIIDWFKLNSYQDTLDWIMIINNNFNYELKDDEEDFDKAFHLLYLDKEDRKFYCLYPNIDKPQMINNEYELLPVPEDLRKQLIQKLENIREKHLEKLKQAENLIPEEVF